MNAETKEGLERFRLESRGETLVFRYPRWRDVRGYLELERALAEQQVMIPAREWTLKDACDRVAKMLTDLELDRGAFLLVEAAGAIVGRGSVEPYHGAGYGVLGLAVSKPYRGRGVGRALMTLLEDEARRLGFERLYLDVWAANAPARALYAKMGFVEIGRRPDWIRRPDLPGGKTDLVEMVKTLD